MGKEVELPANKILRRHALPITAVAAISLGLAACGTSSGAAGTNGGLGSTLVLASLGGSVQTSLTHCAIAPFEKKYGVNVEYEAAQPVQTLAKIEAQKRNPTIDVMWTTPAEQYVGEKEGLFAPRSSAVKGLQNVASNVTYDKYDVPIAQAITGLEYNTKVFSQHHWAPPTSFSDLWNPKYKGHVAIFDISSPFAQALLEEISNENGGSVANIQPGLRKFQQLKPLLFASYDQATDMDTGFQQGNVWIGWDGGFRVYELRQQGVPVAFVQPTDGLLTLTDYMDVIKGAPHSKAASAFISWMLTPHVQSTCITQLGDAPITKGARVPSGLRHYALPEVPVAHTDWNAIEANLSKWTSEWDSIMN